MPRIVLPKLHTGQIDAYNARSKLHAVRCGRRWGKTVMAVAIAADRALNGRRVAIMTPEHKQFTEPYDALDELLDPVMRSSNQSTGRMRLTTGGHIDFWQLNDNLKAGRGREYHDVLIDEAAFTKNVQMMEIFERAIKPTTLTTDGSVWAFSTPNGVDPDNFFYRICTEPKLGWTDFHAPTATNPYVTPELIAKEMASMHPLVAQQEYLAEFVNWSSATFFQLAYFLINGQPVAYPKHCGTVFAIMDCAVKSGSANDATAVLYCAYDPFAVGHKLTWLDYELHMIDAASLEFLAPAVLARCDDLARQCGARDGATGILAEDAAGGSVLIQQAAARGWAVHALDMSLTMKGKDERAMIAGGPAYRGDCKISEFAFNKLVEWRGRTLNHLTQQVTTFRIGDKDAAKRADDLLDCAAYSIIVACADRLTAG